LSFDARFWKLTDSLRAVGILFNRKRQGFEAFFPGLIASQADADERIKRMFKPAMQEDRRARVPPDHEIDPFLERCISGLEAELRATLGRQPQA
jgi:hypothetical protein